LLADLRPDERARAVFLGGALVFHAALWTLALLLAPTLIPTRQLIAEGFSSLAVVAASANLILATRARVIERTLHGLDKLFVTHRAIGLTVAVLVTTHFLLVPKSVGRVPSKPAGYAAFTLLLLAIFIASAPRFPWRRLVQLKYQTWKLTHRFNGLIVALAVTHSLLAHTYVKGMPLLAVYVYGIASVGLLAWLYKESAFVWLGPFAEMKVERSEKRGSGITEVTMARPSGSLPRVAGQFAFVSFKSATSREQHPFTISSSAQRDVRLSIKASGDFTRELLTGVPIGSAVRIEGPYGAFDYHRGLPRQVWLAGGIGVTPFLAMAADLDGDFDVTLVWSVHDLGEAVYADELRMASERNSRLDFRIHNSSEQGHLDAGSIELAHEPRQYSYFICGPLPMRKAAMRRLRELGVPRHRVHFEEFRLR
jgi:predicted ferric reductase